MMETRLHQSSSCFLKQEEHSAGTPPENGVESPLSGDEAAEVSTPSPRKRRGAQKRVVSVPVGDGADGSRSKAEVYPPPDSWSWRKYGQKPIKGSPYPRGYYRCSSSKGCPARKQVERSRLDPTMLLITYSAEHNHPLPTKTHHHHHHYHAAAAAATTTSSSSAATTPTDSAADPVSPKPAPNELAIFADPDPENNSFPELAGDLGWFSDVGSCCFVESPAVAGSTLCHDADVALTLPIREEDQSLFGDLGELPECSVVFRRCRVETPCVAGTG